MRKFIKNKLNKIDTILDDPSVILARIKGCHIDMYQTVRRLYLSGLRPKTIIDVGANRGMFSKCAHIIYPDANIYAFEPIVECFDELEKLKKTIKNLKSYNVAIGDDSKDTFIYRNKYDYSSSLLKMTHNHKQAFPYTAETSKEYIKIDTLDKVLYNENIERPLLLKIDVQGYEDKVLRGAKDLLSGTDYIICELSFTCMYENQPLFDDMYLLMKKYGFEYRGHVDYREHPITREVLQVDALFLRNA
jgi:FkbM family methyltransferase